MIVNVPCTWFFMLLLEIVSSIKNVYLGYCFSVNRNNGNKGTLFSSSSALDASRACTAIIK